MDQGALLNVRQHLEGRPQRTHHSHGEHVPTQAVLGKVAGNEAQGFVRSVARRSRWTTPQSAVPLLNPSPAASLPALLQSVRFPFSPAPLPVASPQLTAIRNKLEAFVSDKASQDPLKSAIAKQVEDPFGSGPSFRDFAQPQAMQAAN